MVGVPRLVEGVDAALADGAVAVGALGRKHVVVALFAVGHAVLVEKGLRVELLAALEASKVLLMPGLEKKQTK